MCTELMVLLVQLCPRMQGAISAPCLTRGPGASLGGWTTLQTPNQLPNLLCNRPQEQTYAFSTMLHVAAAIACCVFPLMLRKLCDVGM